MSQIATTIEQSKRLIEAGVPKKSADMFWKLLDDVDSNDPYICQDDYVIYVLYVDNLPEFVTRCIHAWSLSALWQIVHELDKTYEFSSRLSADELIENLVKTIVYRKTH